ncbi:pre-toxin TG domain-containing protein, partial [Bacillus paramycoides]|nr:pre-toxin TG domain-containing protein [Bacillus paramycoides]
IFYTDNIQSNLMSLNVPDLVGMKTAQLSANSTLIHMYRGVKKKLEEKLQKLIAFNASSPHIFSEIASLQQAVNQGLAQTKTAWNALSGTFTIPSPEALSWTKGIQEKWQDYVERHEPKIEVRAEKVNKGSVGEHTHYNVYVDGVYDEDKTKELKWMFDKESFKESAHFIGDFVFINDIYQTVTGKDWLSGETISRTEAAGMLVLSVLPIKKLEKIAKELKGGNKLLKGVELTEKEEKILKEAGLLDKVGKVENVEKASKAETEIGKHSAETLNRDQTRIVVENLLENGEISVKDLKNMIPEGTPNTFNPSPRIPEGAKYEFQLSDGQKAIIRWHGPDSEAAIKYPGSASGSRWTAQVKVGNK